MLSTNLIYVGGDEVALDLNVLITILKIRRVSE